MLQTGMTFNRNNAAIRDRASYSSQPPPLLPKMHLMYNSAPDGTRIYTLKKVLDGTVTKSAHPARFSPDDKYSRHRVTLKKRYGLLLTQQKDEKKA